MTIKDSHGHAVSGANARSLDAFELACHELRCFAGDPLASVTRALAESPEMTMGHVLMAYLCLFGTEPAGLPAARAALAAAQALPADEREAMHIAAIEHLVEGRWHAAGLLLEDLSVRYPRDALALQGGHQVDFFTGDSRMLRDRITRVATHWHEGLPGYHALLGMQAFGFEENGDYARAEALGRRAVELEPRDSWAWHAVTHVMEMQNRRQDGVRWLRSDTAAWSENNFLAVHNWWHLGLFHLGLDQIDEVMALVDQRILPTPAPVVLEMIDASAMLWRLHLRGIDVGDRWQALAARWAPLAEAGNYAFNDLHAMMAFVGAGDEASAARLLDAQQQALQAQGDNVHFLRDVGFDATRAVHAFGQGRYAEAARLLRPVRSRAHRFGGSHAQRDVLDLTLIEAARRAGDRPLAEALISERAALRA
ncbi:MAG: tetratricopeptide repeat protein [Pseudomonadota bacterium]